MSVTTAPDLTADQAVRASYNAVAAELHRVADAIARMEIPAGIAMSDVELRIKPAVFDRDPVSDAAKKATVDTVARAVLDAPGVIVPTLGAHDWVYYRAERTTGPIKVDVFALVDDPKGHERQSELERLRAEVAELRAAASSVADYALTDRAADVILDLADMHRTGLIRDARTLDDAATAEAAQEADTDQRERAFEDAYAARDETA